MFHDNMTTHWPNSLRRSKAAPKILVNTITGQARLGRELNTTAKVERDQMQKGPICRLQGYTRWTTFLITTL